jgi:hypothetical protein
MKTRNLLAFSVPPGLQERTAAVIEEIRHSPDPGSYRTELIEVILELTRTGLHSYFLLPLERAGVDSVALGTAKLGVTAARRESVPMALAAVSATPKSSRRAPHDVARFAGPWCPVFQRHRQSPLVVESWRGRPGS